MTKLRQMMKDFFDGLAKTISASNQLIRPYLTFFIATNFNAILAWAVITKLMTVNEYVTAVGPMNAMIIGFWFGEKSALSNPLSRTESDK